MSVTSRKKVRGKLLVIEGVDGSGKATQVDILKKRLEKEGVKTKCIDFPRYYNNLFGELIGECLSGKRGDFIKTDAWVASTLYAADRFESSGEIREWINEGFWVVADRYVSANQIHQGGKIKDLKSRKDFLDWLERLEFGVFSLPRPDAVIYLDLPLEVVWERLKSKSLKRTERYLKGGKDVAEADPEYLTNSRNTALDLERRNTDWFKVDCSKKGVCLTPGEVAEEIFDIIEANLMER